VTSKAELTDEAEIPPVVPANEPSLLRRSITGAAWVTVEMSGLQGISLLIFGYLSHLLSPGDFGLAGIAFVTTQTLRSTVQDRIPEAAAIRPAASEADWTAAFWLSAVAGGLLMLGLFAAAAPLEHLLHMPGLAPVLRGMGLVIVTCGFGRTHEQWLIRHMMFRTLALRGLAGALAGGAVGILAARAGWGVAAIVLQQVVGNLLSLTLLWITCPWRPTLGFRLQAALGILRHVRDTAPGGLIYIVSQTCDTVLVGIWFGASAAGLYSLAKRLRQAIQLIAVTPITGIVMPLFTAAMGDKTRHQLVVRRILGTVALVCAPIFAGASFVSGDLIGVIFGPQWAAASPIFAGLVLGGLGLGLQPCFNVILMTHGRPRWGTYLTALEFALSMSFFFACAIVFGQGAIGAAFAAPLAVSIPIAAMLAMRLMGRPLGAWIRDIMPGVVASAVMIAGLFIIAPMLGPVHDVPRLAAIVLMGGLLYGAALAVLFRSAFREMIGAATGMLTAMKRKLYSVRPNLWLHAP
jgi:succinoglycan exporter